MRKTFQQLILEQSKGLNLESWQRISRKNLYGLKLSNLQVALMFGRDHYCSPYIQTILKKLEEWQKSFCSLTSLPNEFLFGVCSYLPLRDLGRFFQTKRKVYDLVHNNNLIWLTVANNYKLKVNPQLEISIKEQILNPWIEMPFGRMNRVTHDLKISKKYLNPTMLELLQHTPDKILPIFIQHIPKDYYFQFEYISTDIGKTYLIFYRNKSGEPKSQMRSSVFLHELVQLQVKLSETLQFCKGEFE